ncbi:tyrosine-type recombinase/integrase [Caproicibacterium amylolyticum]|uniref:Tyrosine-type recombinase/integrase n=2 Tax=Caproicibacterium amylolyticum TaxID=2766537 RepID=A0A7G9WL80_9FIRM|nr:tyrosine-type recombinase/integrase [Caproicibacterium amylolyticum]
MKVKECIAEFLYECQIRQFTKKTVKGYRNALNVLQQFLDSKGVEQIEDVNVIVLKSFFAEMIKTNHKETYINGLLKVCRALWKYLCEQEYITVNPTLKVRWAKEPKTIIKTFTDDEVKRMLKVYSKGKDYLSIRNQTVMEMLFDTGVRCFELCELSNKAIEDSYIRIYGKGKKERQVGLSPYMIKQMMKYERTFKEFFCYRIPKYDNYFLSRTGRPLTVVAVENIVKRCGIQANVRDEIRCSPHTCRHWFAQAQLKNGIDVYSLSRLMGHENIKITQRYLQGLQDADVVSKSIKTSPLMNL